MSHPAYLLTSESCFSPFLPTLGHFLLSWQQQGGDFEPWTYPSPEIKTQGSPLMESYTNPGRRPQAKAHGEAVREGASPFVPARA